MVSLIDTKPSNYFSISDGDCSSLHSEKKIEDTQVPYLVRQARNKRRSWSQWFPNPMRRRDFWHETCQKKGMNANNNTVIYLWRLLFRSMVFNHVDIKWLPLTYQTDDVGISIFCLDQAKHQAPLHKNKGADLLTKVRRGRRLCLPFWMGWRRMLLYFHRCICRGGRRGGVFLLRDVLGVESAAFDASPSRWQSPAIDARPASWLD